MPLVKSKGNMYSWTTHMHTHLGGQCPHKCSYCLTGDTLILMANGSQKPIKNILVGDYIVGIERKGRYSYYTKTVVLNKSKTRRYSIKLETTNGTVVECSADHRWRNNRGEYVHTIKGNETTHNLGKYCSISCISTPTKVYKDTEKYKQGYLCGAIKGDGHLAVHNYLRKDKKYKYYEHQHHFRLACKDSEIVDTVEYYLKSVLNLGCKRFEFPMMDRSGKIIKPIAIRNHTTEAYNKIKQLISPILTSNTEWSRGFLAGAFDSEGSYNNVIRISNLDESFLSTIEQCYDTLKFRYIRENKSKSKAQVIRLLGGLSEQVRFFETVNPKIQRKFSYLFGTQVKNSTPIRNISYTNRIKTMYDLTTETGNFIANGLISHNCYVQRNRFGVNPKYQGDLRIIPQELNVNYGSDKIIFIEHMNDMFAKGVSRNWIMEILEHCCKYPNNQYIFQTKNPENALLYKHNFPKNFLIGTTIETDSDGVLFGKTQAPSPIDRYIAMLEWAYYYPEKTFVTIEPIMAFNVAILSGWIRGIRPLFVNIGADSKFSELDEPSKEDIEELIRVIKDADIEIRVKSNLERLMK